MIKSVIFFIGMCLFAGYTYAQDRPTKMQVIFDTDANNEVDDQFALAYLLFNGHVFDVKGVTVNATYNGGEIDDHYEEAKRIMKLADRYGKIPLLKGANGSFEDIKSNLDTDNYDGAEAVEFIIDASNKNNDLILIAVGKLTNVALAIEKDPSIASKMKVVWLGSNYPKPGEYNQDNDTVAMNYILKTEVPFDMVTVRYGSPTGTDAVRVTPQEIKQNIAGLGPEIEEPVTGRHGGEFTNFGDYGINLFENIHLHGNPPSRALFDMAAVAILKNSSWADGKEIPAPILINNQWVEKPDNSRRIKVWENFDRDAIIEDMHQTMNNYQLTAPTKE